jgi:hypothetical protein
MVLLACSPIFPLLDLDTVSAEEKAAALNVRTYTLDDGGDRPTVGQVLKHLEAYSCKNLLSGGPPSRGDALLQLQLKAARLGADAILDVTFAEGGTVAVGTNCWETIRASGIAVKLKSIP